MATLRFVTGDATSPVADGNKIIAHVCNDVGGWGRGFVVAISRRWPEPEREFRRWYSDGAGFALGAVRFVQVEPATWVANMIGQHGLLTDSGTPPVRYDAVAQCLDTVAGHASTLHASVHMPRIGTGLAGGDWSAIEPIIVRTLCARDIPTTVYDLG